MRVWGGGVAGGGGWGGWARAAAAAGRWQGPLWTLVGGGGGRDHQREKRGSDSGGWPTRNQTSNGRAAACARRRRWRRPAGLPARGRPDGVEEGEPLAGRAAAATAARASLGWPRPPPSAPGGQRTWLASRPSPSLARRLRCARSVGCAGGQGEGVEQREWPPLSGRLLSGWRGHSARARSVPVGMRGPGPGIGG